jgi:hypothetical protein
MDWKEDTLVRAQWRTARAVEQEWVCAYCTISMTPSEEGPRRQRVSLDHKIPLSRDGEHAYGNTLACCYGCNSKKAGLTDDEFRAFLAEGAIAIMFQPKHRLSAKLIRAIHKAEREYVNACK